MKLFGGHGRKIISAGNRRYRMTGRVRGILGIALSLCILSGTVFAISRSYIKPVERKSDPAADSMILSEKNSDVSEGVVRQKKEASIKKDRFSSMSAARMPKTAAEGVYNILLLGTDGDGFRTDTIMLAHLDTKKKSAALLSIPRDCAVQRADGSLLKINAVYNGGGADGVRRLEDTLEKMLGFRPDGYVLIDLEGFRQTVDRMGGVWFDVPQDLYYSDPAQDLLIDLHKGYQLLDGQQALGLVRYRKGYATQDIQRTKVQQQFLLAAAKQLCSAKNLLRLRELTELFTQYVQTDLSVGNLFWFAEQMLGCSLDSITSHTPEGEGIYIDGISYYALYENALLRTLNGTFNPFDEALTAEDISIISPEKAEAYRALLQGEDETEADVQEKTEPETNTEEIQPPELDMTGLEEIE